MTIVAVLSIDDGKTLNDTTTFPVKPAVGERVRFWKDGRVPKEATISATFYQQGEDGYYLVVEAVTQDIDAWIEGMKG